MKKNDLLIYEILKQTDSIFLITDVDFRIIFYSKGLKKIIGRKKTIEGMHISEIFEIREKADCVKNLKRKAKNRIKVKLKGIESKFICDASKQNIEGGGIFYLFIFHEVEKSTNIASTQMILDAIPMPVFFENEKGELANCNMAFEKLIQTPRHILISNKKSKKIIDICKIEEEKENNLKVVFEEKIIKNTNENKRVYILIKSPYLTETMKYGGKVGVFNDITEEREIYQKLIINENKTKEAELLFRSLWENSLDGFRLVDKNGNINLVNDSYCLLVEKKREELLGKLFTIVYSEPKTHIYEKFKQRFQKNEIREHSEDYVNLWNGKKIWLEALNKVIYIKDVPYVLSIFRDVSKRRMIEDELKNYLSFETIISNLNKNYLTGSIENINEVFSKNLEEIGKYLKVSFTGLFLKKGNRIQLSQGWYKDDKMQNKTFLENNNVIANLKINKLLREKNIVLIKNDDEKLLQKSRILKNDLINYDVSFLLLMPLVVNDALIGYLGAEGNNNRFEEFNITIAKLKSISDNFVNLLIRNKNIKLIKREKEELETILKNIIDGVITTNKHEVIVHANDAVFNMLGKEKSAILGKNMRYFASLFIQNTEKENKEEAFRFYKFITSFKIGTDSFKLLMDNGEIKIISISITEIANAAGENDGYIYIFWDITEKINTEKKVAFSQKMEAIGQLSAGIAHEINTPMQYINDNNRFLAESLGYFSQFVNELVNNNYSVSGNVPVEYIRKLLTEKDLHFYLEEGISATSQSQTGIERVINIIKVMKDFSHPGQTTKVLTNINNCVEVTTTISKNAWKYFAELEMKLDKNLPLVICNAQEINQVLLNMIVNSAQAIDESIKMGIRTKGHIFIETYSTEDNVVIKMKDDGIGIKQENINKIFDMFFTTKEVGKGTGQGLAISYDIIVNKHNGKIDVDSKYTFGTSFEINLPIN
jgi:PAS domain S-box-containing protein